MRRTSAAGSIMHTGRRWKARARENSGLNEPDPPDLSLWALHGFCLGARQTPHRSVRADNNGQILYQARTDVTRAQLAAAGVPCLESQITLLNMMGLLSVDGEVLRTTFPTLGAESMRMLRFQSARRAAVLMGILVHATDKLAEVLASGNALQHHYAVLFGHGLDGLMWEHVRGKEVLPSTAL